jgi:3-oxoacyl-[acyl-carrier protein] reductase
MLRLAGRKCVVTGGGKGIGRGIALAFGLEGADVAIVDRNAQAGKATAAEINALGRLAAFYQADVSQEQQVVECFAEFERTFGSTDVLVNNAGGGVAAPILGMSTELWENTIRANLHSTFYCTRAVLPAMMERRYGRIINISSQLAHKGAPDLAAYAAAKAGVIGFTRSLAHELTRHGILVNVICPGPVDTDELRAAPVDWLARKKKEMPIGRFGRVEEIAPTAVLLASEEGSFYAGATLNPNGGDVMI